MSVGCRGKLVHRQEAVTFGGTGGMRKSSRSALPQFFDGDFRLRVGVITS
jgi:hypothetical protein